MFGDYYREAKYIVDSLAFDYKGGHYTGHGKLTWKPETGFHIEAFLQRSGEPAPTKWGIGGLSVVSQADRRTIRMRLRRNGIAVAPNVLIVDEDTLFFENHLDITVSPVISLDHASKGGSSREWWGACLCKVGTGLTLPDIVKREEKISNEVVKHGFFLAGLVFDNKGDQKITGYLDDAKNLALRWRFDKARWTTAQCWAWPNAACQALSILTGEHVRLLRKEFFKERRMTTEMHREAGVESLGALSLFDSGMIMDKQAFIELTEFMVRNTAHGRICSQLFHQVLEASRQRSWQAKELLVSTALEAALRSIDGVPFKTKKSKNKVWEIEASLEGFRQKYLSSEWTSKLQRVRVAHFRLRDRNSHPDWLLGTGGAMATSAIEASLDDMILLTRFYGYMILALSGKKGLEPAFPIPHRNWRPLILVEKTE